MARVVLLEPDVVLAKAYQLALEKAGHTVVRTASPDSALTYIDEQDVDILVLELLLGAHNGIELMYEMRSYADLRRLPVIIHSHADPSLVQDAPGYRALRVHSYVYKPDSKQADLVAAVDQALQAQPATS